MPRKRPSKAALEREIRETEEALARELKLIEEEIRETLNGSSGIRDCDHCLIVNC